MTACRIDLNIMRKDLKPIFPGIQDAIAPVFSPVESLRIIISDKKVMTVVSDLFLIFNQERIAATLGEDSLRVLYNQMSQASSSKTISSNLTDDERLSLLKSRFIQTPGEIQSWYSGLLSRFGNLIKQKSEIEAEELLNQQSDQALAEETPKND